MESGKHGLRRPGIYQKKGEGGDQFSFAEGSPAHFRKKIGTPKDVGVGRSAKTQHTSSNLPQTYQEAARMRAVDGV